MTPAEIQSITNKHVDAWLTDVSETGPTCRVMVDNAIREALDLQKAHFQAGANTLAFERDTALRRLAEMTQARDDAVEAAKLIAGPQ